MGAQAQKSAPVRGEIVTVRSLLGRPKRKEWCEVGIVAWLRSALVSGSRASIPETEATHAARLLDEFCAENPALHRDQLWYSYRIKGRRVTLIEGRPSFRDTSKTTEVPVAVFEYRSDRRWALMWADRNSRWRRYEGFESVSFQRALEEVEKDPTGIFFG